MHTPALQGGHERERRCACPRRNLRGHGTRLDNTWELIMSKTNSPISWQAPAWHPDFGDPQIELDHLREVAFKLLELSPGCSIVLETPEPGVIYIEVTRSDAAKAEIHSVSSGCSLDTRRYGIFIAPDTSEEIEEYAESPDHAARIALKNRSN